MHRSILFLANLFLTMLNNDLFFLASNSHIEIEILHERSDRKTFT